MINPMMGNGMNQGMPNMGVMPNMAGMGGMMPGMGGMPGVGCMMPGMGGMTGVMPGMGQMQPGMVSGFVGGNQAQAENEEWLKGFNMGVQEVSSSGDPDVDKPGPKINIIFNTTQGTATNLVIPYGTTVEGALEKYLKRMGRPELIGSQDNKICFLFNANKMKFGDQTPVEQFFKNAPNPKVVVNDINNLIGA